MADAVPERLVWAVDRLAPKPGDDVLEIGCGTGAAATVILERLTTGRLVAIDRSAHAIRAATKRNAAAIAEGRATFHEVDLASASLDGARFDRALAVNVNVFWMRPRAELVRLRAVMKPGAPLVLVYHPPFAQGHERIVDNCMKSLGESGFTHVEVRTEALRDTHAIAIAAVRAADG